MRGRARSPGRTPVRRHDCLRVSMSFWTRIELFVTEKFVSLDCHDFFLSFHLLTWATLYHGMAFRTESCIQDVFEVVIYFVLMI